MKQAKVEDWREAQRQIYDAAGWSAPKGITREGVLSAYETAKDAIQCELADLEAAAAVLRKAGWMD